MVEGRLPHQQLIRQYAQTPQVHSQVVLHALEDLRGSVVEGTAVGLPALVDVYSEYPSALLPVSA